MLATCRGLREGGVAAARLRLCLVRVWVGGSCGSMDATSGVGAASGEGALSGLAAASGGAGGGGASGVGPSAGAGGTCAAAGTVAGISLGQFFHAADATLNGAFAEAPLITSLQLRLAS